MRYRQIKTGASLSVCCRRFAPLGFGNDPNQQRFNPKSVAFLPLCGRPVHLNDCRAAVAAALMDDHRPRCSFDFDSRSFRIATLHDGGRAVPLLDLGSDHIILG
jgi:hypothetical protein